MGSGMWDLGPETFLADWSVFAAVPVFFLFGCVLFCLWLESIPELLEALWLGGWLIFGMADISSCMVRVVGCEMGGGGVKCEM